jgi:hypothetical protein
LCEEEDDTPVGGVEETKSAERVPSPVPTSTPAPKRVAFPPDVAASMSGSSTASGDKPSDPGPGAPRTVKLAKTDNSANAVKPGMSRDEAAFIWRSWSAMRRSKTNVTRLKFFCAATGIEYAAPKSRTVAALNQELK